MRRLPTAGIGRSRIRTLLGPQRLRHFHDSGKYLIRSRRGSRVNHQNTVATNGQRNVSSSSGNHKYIARHMQQFHLFVLRCRLRLGRRALRQREPLVEVIYRNLKQVLRGGIRPAKLLYCPELLELFSPIAF